MPASGFTERSFEFLYDLEDNNHRDWFVAHKADYHTTLRDPFAELLEELSDRLVDADIPLVGGRKTMFRINRDVRFSKDKRPYKTVVSGMLTPTGVKDPSVGVLYLHLSADGGFVASGFHGLNAGQLLPIRTAMIERADTFQGILDGLADAGRALGEGNTLKSMPRGFSAHADHRHAPHIKRKSLLIQVPLSPATWISGDIVDVAESLAMDAMPLLGFEAPG